MVLPKLTLVHLTPLLLALAWTSCRDVSADGFPVSVGGNCPPGFSAQERRCFRSAGGPDDGGRDSAGGKADAQEGGGSSPNGITGGESGGRGRAAPPRHGGTGPPSNQAP